MNFSLQHFLSQLKCQKKSCSVPSEIVIQTSWDLLIRIITTVFLGGVKALRILLEVKEVKEEILV